MKEHASHRPTAIRALLLALLMAASTIAITANAQGDGALYETTDATGDVELRAQSQGAGVPSQAAQSADLVALRILDEDAETLMLQVQVDDMRGPSAHTDGFREPTVYIRFRVEGSPAYYHLFAVGISGRGTDTVPNDQPSRVQATLCISNDEIRPFPDFTFDLYNGCYYQAVPAITFPADDVVEILVPKIALLGVGGEGDVRPTGIPQAIDAGDRLIDWRVELEKRAENSLPLFSISGTRTAVYHDQMPDEGVADPYTLQAPAANAYIALRAKGSQGGVFTGTDASATWEDVHPVTYVGIAPDPTVLLPVDVYNGASSKRLVNLTAGFPASASGRFDVQVAPVIEVPAGETRQVNVLLNATEPLAHRETVDLEIRGASLGHEDEVASALLRLIGNQPPTADQNQLYFHGIEDYGDQPTVVPSPFICFVECDWRIASWMNTMANDPLDEVGEGGMRSQFYFSTLNVLIGSNQVYTRFFNLDAPLAKDVHFNPERPIEATLTFSAGTDIEATAILSLSGTIAKDDCPPEEGCREGVFIGQESQDVVIGSEPTEVDIAIHPPPDLDVLSSAGGFLRAHVVVESDDPAAAAHGTVDAFDLVFHPGLSHVSLPVVPDPEPAAADGLFVSLDVAGETEEFVNPGKSRAFHVLAVNEGVEESAIRLQASPDVEGWTARLEPGDQYRLQPGQSVNVTVLVTAPASAEEGEAADIEVVAHDRDGDGSSRPVSLKAIATAGVDIENDEGSVEVDEDTKARLDVGEGGDSPGLGTAAMLAIALAAAVGLRRRPST